MLSKLLEKADLQSWSTITLQTAIITLDALLYTKVNQNSFLILSGTLILSLFSLQVVSRRFLMLYPIQQYMNRPSQKIDTSILRCFLIISISFMLFGSIENDLSSFSAIESFLSSNLYWIIPIFVPLLPLLWHFLFDELVRKSFVKDMTEHTVEQYGQCPNPECKNMYAYFNRSVISQNCGKVSVECKYCSKKYEFKEPINIGY